MALDNATPTIVNLAPTRRRGRDDTPKNEPTGILAMLESFDNEKKAFVQFGLEDDLSDPESDVALEPIDEQEIYDLISTISDPEHPLSLGSLAVVNLSDIHITPSPGTPNPDGLTTVLVELTPTITHCSLATVIGLGVRVRLDQALPAHFRVDVRIKPGTHSQDDQVNKQLADKERVAAALENATLLGVIMKMLETCV